jgi:hypothetical protein
MLIMLLVSLSTSCKDECNGDFRTVAELDNFDFGKCGGEKMYAYMQHYSGGYGSVRKAKGIPSLPDNFVAMVWTVDNQVRWINEERIEDRSFKQPYYKYKNIEWNGEMLKYDVSVFVKNDAAKSWLRIAYWQDTLSKTRGYKFSYDFGNDAYAADSTSALTKHQADSILKDWKLDY